MGHPKRPSGSCYFPTERMHVWQETNRLNICFIINPIPIRLVTCTRRPSNLNSTSPTGDEQRATMFNCNRAAQILSAVPSDLSAPYINAQRVWFSLGLALLLERWAARAKLHFLEHYHERKGCKAFPLPKTCFVKVTGCWYRGNLVIC